MAPPFRLSGTPRQKGAIFVLLGKSIFLATATMLLLGMTVVQNEPTMNEPEMLLQSRQQCPTAVQRARGVYKDSSQHEEFRNTVVLVALNYGYYDFLQNWEFLADKLDLKWAVVAMDDTLYEKLGSERAVRAQVNVSTESSSFREHNFNQISCNKMRVVLNIMMACQVDVVFSDVDNVFLKDPFQHEFGRLIASKQFDYIYQPNEWQNDAREHPHAYESFQTGELPWEANTGFYYLNRHCTFIQTIIRRVLDRCSRPYNWIDDQTLFWKEFHSVVGPRLFERSPEQKVQHCRGRTTEEMLARARVGTVQPMRGPAPVRLCCMDPFYHPTGSEKSFPILNSEEVITYHANFAIGKEWKREKLRRILPTGYGWDDSRITEA